MLARNTVVHKFFDSRYGGAFCFLLIDTMFGMAGGNSLSVMFRRKAQEMRGLVNEENDPLRRSSVERP